MYAVTWTGSGILTGAYLWLRVDHGVVPNFLALLICFESLQVATWESSRHSSFVGTRDCQQQGFTDYAATPISPVDSIREHGQTAFEQYK